MNNFNNPFAKSATQSGSQATDTTSFSFEAPSFSSRLSFGSVFQQPQSSSPNNISSPSTVFDGSIQSTLGDKSSLFSSTQNSATPFSGFTGHPTFSFSPSLTTFELKKSDGHEFPNSKPIFGEPNSAAIGTNSQLGTMSFNSGFYPSAKSRCQGTRVASYVATPEMEVKQAVTTQSPKLVSISAMLTYKDKSHEELRLEDYQLSKEKGSSLFNNNLTQQTHSSLAKKISGSSPAFGSSSQSTCGNNGALFSSMYNLVLPFPGFKIPAVSFPSAPSFTTYKFGKSDGHESLNPQSHFGQIIGTNQELGTRSFSAGSHPSAKSQCQGTKVASYVATPETEVRDAVTTQDHKIVSISAMPTYKDKSHEELRLEDYQLSKEEGITSGFSSDMNNILSSKFQFLETQDGTANTLSKLTLAQNEPEMLRHTSPGLEFKFGIPPLSKTEVTFSSNSASLSISNQPSTDPNAETGSQKINIQQSAAHSNLAIGGLPITNPFRGEPTLQISVDCPVSNIAIQYGISSLSVNDNPSPIKRNIAAVRHRSFNRNRPAVKKYKPERDDKKVPFFQEGLPDACKLKAPFIPRSDPKAWLRNLTEEQYPESKTNKPSVLENKSTGIHDTGISIEANKEKDGGCPPQFNLTLNGTFDGHGSQEGENHRGHQSDEAATLRAHVLDIQRMMPKLQCPEYYTIPPIDELVAKEKTEPGFCRRVKDFVVGRYGYGSIKFSGETDVTNLDLESVVKMNYREVIVYMDELKKPPVGQGLNKPAEITLLNVKCIDKSTGKLHVDGPMVDKYRQILIKKGAKQGVDFVSYDPISGEWKFRVPHF